MMHDEVKETVAGEKTQYKSQSNLEAALVYAQRGWPVLPLFGIQDGQCMCGKEDCSSPGKHPRTAHGVKNATTKMPQIETWWMEWPTANIGIATGEGSGFVVLDVDPRHGGDESLQQLERDHGLLPSTIESVTGGKGRHLYFGLPKDAIVGNSVERLGEGLDIRSTGGYIIAPPSHHVSGGQYVWKEGYAPDERELAELPDWLLERLQTPESAYSPLTITDGKIKKGQRNDTLFKIGCCLRGRGFEQEAIEANLLLVNGLQCDPPLEEAEIRTIAASASSYAINTEGDEWVNDMNEIHAVVMAGKTVILNLEHDPYTGQQDISLSHKADLQLRYANRTVQVGEDFRNIALAWLEHPQRKEYHGIIFSPNQEVPGYYNLWQGFAVKPKEGDCSLYLDHIKDNIAQGDDKIYWYLLAWMAQCVQEPENRPGVALFLRGKQGTGKGVFVTQFGKLFGKHFVHVTNTKHLTGNFNAHLKHALLVFADEAFLAGDNASEGTLKAMVTEEQLPIEFKGQDVFYVQNHIHLMVASNHDWVVPTGKEERRFCVLEVGEQHMQDHQYFGKLVDQMEEHGGREALLHYLLHYDLTGVNLREFPQTQALQDNKLLSMSPVEKFWYERLMDGNLLPGDQAWPGWVVKYRLHKEFVTFSKTVAQSRKSTETELGMTLIKLVPGLRSTKKKAGGKRELIWEFPDLQTCRQHFDQLTNYQHPWPGEEEGK